MNTDKYLAIGHSHKICEDYVLEGSLAPSLSYLIVSDGCSGSPDTDVGARIVSYAFLKYLKEWFGPVCKPLESDNWKPSVGLKYILEDLAQKPIDLAANVTSQISVNRLSLDCTVVLALSTPAKTIIMFFGDGAAIIEHLDGSKTYYQISYENDMPYYVSYFLDDNRRYGYILQCNPKVSKRVAKISKEGVLIHHGTEAIMVTRDDPFEPYLWSTEIVEDAKSIIITSDGIKSFQKEKEASIDSLEIAQRLSNFKNYNGQFIQRRLHRMQDEFKKEDISHYDDFSVAGIRI